LSNQEFTISNKLSWIPIVETFFVEIINKNIPEKMRQNMLMTRKVITSSIGEYEQYTCLFFRASNMMAFFRKELRFSSLMNVSSIHTAQNLLEELDKAGVLAFGKCCACST